MESSTHADPDQWVQNPSYFLYGPGEAKIKDHAIPRIEDPHDVLIRIAFTGVCGSDVSTINLLPILFVLLSS
jgi:threonine dehydrogenase-like Zn-dependent dehydrogenase